MTGQGEPISSERRRSAEGGLGRGALDGLAVSDHRIRIVWPLTIEASPAARRQLEEALEQPQRARRRGKKDVPMWQRGMRAFEPENGHGLLDHVYARFIRAPAAVFSLTERGRAVLGAGLPLLLEGKHQALVWLLDAHVLLMADHTVFCVLDLTAGTVPSFLQDLRAARGEAEIIGGHEVGENEKRLRWSPAYHAAAEAPVWAPSVSLLADAVCALRRSALTGLKCAAAVLPGAWVRSRPPAAPRQSGEFHYILNASERDTRPYDYLAGLAAGAGSSSGRQPVRQVFRLQDAPELLFRTALAPLLGGADLQDVGWDRFFMYVAARVEAADGLADAEARTLLFHLANGFDATYRPPARWDDLAFASPLGTRWHATSTYGAAALIVDDGGTPFNAQLMRRLERDYFLLYLVALHQRQVLSTLAARAASTLSPEDLASDPGPGHLEKVRVLRGEVAEFHLRVRARLASHLPLHEAAYRSHREGMHLEALFSEVSDEVAEIDEWLSRGAAEEHARRDRELNVAVAVVTLFVLPITVAASILGMNLESLTGQGPRLMSPIPMWVIGISYAVMVAAYFGLKLAGRTKKKRKRWPVGRELRAPGEEGR